MIFKNPEHYLFNNGPALLHQLQQIKVQNYLQRISDIEQESQFRILKYWNRRWEYPFILSIFETMIPQGCILDAGAGKSLMPFILQGNEIKISALDIDDGSFYKQNSLGKWYQQMNNKLGTKVDFVNGDLTNTNFRNGEFGFIYSISVLEHLSNPYKGLTELWRILGPGGIIALTMDISLDDTRGMYSADFKKIRSFFSNNAIPLYPEDFNITKDVITTDWFKKNEPEALPWKVQYRDLTTRIKNFMKGRWNQLGYQTRIFSSLFVAGLVYRKPK